MDSRAYQNILHVVGTTSSVITILGVIKVSEGNFWGIVLMFIGAAFTRISSEIEFQKIRKIIKEK